VFNHIAKFDIGTQKKNCSIVILRTVKDLISNGDDSGNRQCVNGTGH